MTYARRFSGNCARQSGIEPRHVLADLAHHQKSAVQLQLARFLAGLAAPVIQRDERRGRAVAAVVAIAQQHFAGPDPVPSGTQVDAN